MVFPRKPTPAGRFAGLQFLVDVDVEQHHSFPQLRKRPCAHTHTSTQRNTLLSQSYCRRVSHKLLKVCDDLRTQCLHCYATSESLSAETPLLEILCRNPSAANPFRLVVLPQQLRLNNRLPDGARLQTIHCMMKNTRTVIQCQCEQSDSETEERSKEEIQTNHTQNKGNKENKKVQEHK